MLLTFLLFGGGFIYWFGLIADLRRVAMGAAAILVLALGVMLADGGIDPRAIPFLVLAGLLAFALKRFDLGLWRYVGWTVFLALVLALGLRILPFFTPVETIQTAEHLYRFPPEKVILMLLVPPMVLVPWAAQDSDQRPERPWRITLLILAGILVTVLPLALITGFVRPGFAAQSAPFLAYWLAYNLIYTCVLEESFFRGILQNALIRNLNVVVSSVAARFVGIAAASVLFGLAHFAGGTTYVILAAIAGVGYGLAYELTGRLHHAVLVHFAVNTAWLLAFSGA